MTIDSLWCLPYQRSLLCQINCRFFIQISFCYGGIMISKNIDIKYTIYKKSKHMLSWMDEKLFILNISHPPNSQMKEQFNPDRFVLASVGEHFICICVNHLQDSRLTHWSILTFEDNILVLSFSWTIQQQASNRRPTK